MKDSFLHHSYEFKLSNLEKKSNKCNFSGYATLFDIIDCYNDIISHEAFNSVKGKCVLLWQHNHFEPIGKITSITKDDKGLYVTGELCLGIQKASDVYHMLKEDIIDSMSIGYTANDYEYIKHSDGRMIRMIRSIKLWEISLVTFPAYEGAKITNIKNNCYGEEICEFDDSEEKANRRHDKNDEAFIKNLDDIINALKNNK